MRYRSIPRSEKLLGARHRRFHPQCQDDGGSIVTGQPFELDTAGHIDPLRWTPQRPRQRLQNRGDSVGRRGLRAARIQRLAQALVADVDAVGPEADDEVARQVRLEEFAGAARAHDEVGLPGQSHSGRAPGGRSEASITLGSWSATAKCRLSGPLLGVARPASVIPHLLVSRRTLVVESPDQRANPSSAHFRPAHTWQSVRLPHRFPHSGPWVAGTGSAPEVAAQPCGSGRLRHPVKADRVTVCRELGRTPAPTSLDSPLPARAIQQRTWNTFPTSPAGRDAQIGSFPLPGPPIDGCRKAPVCGCVNPTTNCSTPLGCVTYS